ncbi:Conserved_hypothetical protein [Hexamita inflata]|uniref:KilA-N domain-containing protein n=1 Tax=Hexamita inflata TaxID=28002 RepID=A0AA86RE59_9EUKA|nr:Conserved hypothetical protein [Hexamita inflata]
MQNTINFNNTKIEDINEIIAIAQHGDLKLVFNKQDNFICCSSLVYQLKPQADVYKFFKLQTTESLIGGSQEEVSQLYYKMTKAQIKSEGLYTGYYIHQDLFYAFMLWLCPSKFIQYSRLLNIILQNITIENQIQNKDSEINLQTIIDKLQIENQELKQKLNKQNQTIEIKDKIIDKQDKIIEIKQDIIETKASIQASEELRIYMKPQPITLICGKPMLDSNGQQCFKLYPYIRAVLSTDRNNQGMEVIKTYPNVPNSKDVLKYVREQANYNCKRHSKYMIGNWFYSGVDELYELIEQAINYYTENKQINLE